MPQNQGTVALASRPPIARDADEHTRLLALSSEVGRALTENMTLNASLQWCAQAIVQYLDGAFARIWTLNEAGDTLELQASAGLYTHLDGPHSRVPVGKFKIGLIAEERKPHLTNAVVGDPRVGDQEWARREGMVAFAGHPLIVADQVVGVMAMFARQPLPEITLTALATIADQIAVGIERQQSDRRLREQTEVLAALYRIGQALFAELDPQKLAQTCADAATELTGAQFGAFLYKVENAAGEAHTRRVIPGVPQDNSAPFPLSRRAAIFALTFAGESIIRLDDATQDARCRAFAPANDSSENSPPLRSYLAVPVVARSGEITGGLFFGHEQAGVFTDRHEDIVEGLAVQTAIALDNARLYQLERERGEQLAIAIQEVHHRVKNSLQGVSALLEMQLPYDSDVVPAETVRESLNQIKTIALVYDLLARDQPIGKVDAGRVLSKLVELLCAGMKTTEQNDPIRAQTEQVWIPTKAATALALAVNELVSNAYKHSRKANRKDTGHDAAIEVSLTKQNDEVHVSVQDVGPGFPPDFDPLRYANIGLELVDTLVRHDLHGTVAYSNAADPDTGDVRGGRVVIVFSENVLSE